MVGNDFGGGISSFAFVEQQCFMETLRWNWQDLGQGAEGGEGAVLDTPNRAGKEEQDPSPGHSIRSCAQTQTGGSNQWITEFQSRRNDSAATEEFYLEKETQVDGDQDLQGSMEQHG